MQPLRVLLVTLALGQATVTSVGGQQPAAAVALDRALELFHLHSPELMLARSRLGSALGNARQDQALTNPIVAYSSENVGNYSERYLSLTQPVDFLWGLGARGDRTDAQRQRALARFSADSAGLVLEVRRAYLKAWSAGETSRVARALDSTVAGVLQAARARFAEGDLAGYDVRRLETELAKARRRRALAEVDQQAAEERLGAMIAEAGMIVPSRPAPLPDRPPVIAAGFDAPGLAMIRRQEVAQAQAAVQMFTAEATLARGGILSGAGVTGAYKHQSDAGDGLLLGVQVPIPIFDQRSGAVDAARAGAAGAAFEVELVRRTVAREASLAFHRITALERALAVLGAGPVEAGGGILDIARIAYEQGEVGIVELLDAANASFDARLRDTATRVELWEAYFELDRAVGGFPDTTVTGVRP